MIIVTQTIKTFICETHAHLWLDEQCLQLYNITSQPDISSWYITDLLKEIVNRFYPYLSHYKPYITVASEETGTSLGFTIFENTMITHPIKLPLL